MKQTKKRRTGLLAAAVFWLAVWQAAAMAIGQEVFLGVTHSGGGHPDGAAAAGRFLAAGGVQRRA